MIPHDQFMAETCEGGWTHATRIVRTISRNGTIHVSLRCYHCNQRSEWIKHDTLRKEYGIEPEEAEIWHDNLCACGGGGCERCAPSACEVGTCGSYLNVELHHWAQRSKFKDCDDWPTSYLCRHHHIFWHNAQDKR